MPDNFIQVPDRKLGTHYDLHKHFNRVMADCSDEELPKLMEARHRAFLLANGPVEVVEKLFKIKA